MTTGSESSADQLARRFNLGCLIALLPRAERAVALQELIDVDPRFFHLGYDHPPPVIESAVADGTPEVRRAVARATGTEDAQERLFAMDQPDIDAALADNPYLPYDLACRLRLRRPPSWRPEPPTTPTTTAGLCAPGTPTWSRPP
ncbi:hypothetical protein ACFQ9X_21200 [Catenulispora yoronensis]